MPLPSERDPQAERLADCKVVQQQGESDNLTDEQKRALLFVCRHFPLATEVDAIAGRDDLTDSGRTDSDFVRRGLAAIARSEADGDWIPAETVIAKLEAKLAAAKLLRSAKCRANGVFEEHSTVILDKPLPTLALEKGSSGVVVHIHAGGCAYEVEFLTNQEKRLACRLLTQRTCCQNIDRKASIEK